MARQDVRFVERSYMSLLLEADPDYYATRNNGHEYEFSNGRRFKEHVPYTGYGPTFDYRVAYEGDHVTYGGDYVSYTTEPF